MAKEQKEQSMRKHFLAATIVAAVSAPIAAQAQSTVGVAGPQSTGTVIVDSGAVGIAAEQRPAFRAYIVRERVPNYTVPDRVVVLVEPRSRRIVQVID
jgi:hypothetical protein